jgi:hypothetical protein
MDYQLVEAFNAFLIRKGIKVGDVVSFHNASVIKHIPYNKDYKKLITITGQGIIVAIKVIIINKLNERQVPNTSMIVAATIEDLDDISLRSVIIPLLSCIKKKDH